MVPSFRYRNIVTDTTVSIYGSIPNSGAWVKEQYGWTIRDNVTNTVGIGRAPFLTENEAIQHLNNNPHVFRNI